MCVRCVVCIMTDGVVSTPLEAIPKIAESTNQDGIIYGEIYYVESIREQVLLQFYLYLFVSTWLEN